MHALLKFAGAKTLLLLLLPVFMSACSTEKYSKKPIDPVAGLVKFERKNLSGTDFQNYLIANGYRAEQLPFQAWGLDELTYCALFFHPDLDVSRAQWRAALQAETSASQRAMPVVNSHLAHSDDPDPTKRPFALGLSIDIPIETANKRAIRIEHAKYLSEMARLEIAQTAWRLRQAIAQTLSEYQFNQQEAHLLAQEEAYRQAIVAIYQKRADLGEASKLELSNAKLQLMTLTSLLEASVQNGAVLQSKLAGDLGLPIAQVSKIQLKLDDIRQSAEFSTERMQTDALLNRLDIRIALLRYAAAEAKLKLEIAKQYPDLTLSPGYAFEFGDNIWSLGISSLLNFLNKNKINIAEATKLREVEAAQFEALQTKVITETKLATSELNLAKQTLANQLAVQSQQIANTQRIARKFSAGETDRLEMTLAQLENINAQRKVNSAKLALSHALNQLENTLQQPLTKKIDLNTTEIYRE